MNRTTFDPDVETIIIHAKLDKKVLQERIQRILTISDNKLPANVFLNEDLTSVIYQDRGEDTLEVLCRGLCIGIIST
jgi:hypothetical protein